MLGQAHLAPTDRPVVISVTVARRLLANKIVSTSDRQRSDLAGRCSCETLTYVTARAKEGSLRG